MKPPVLQRLMLGDICKLRGGSAFKPALQGRSGGDYPFIKVSDFNTAGNEIVIQGANNWVDQTDRKSIQGKPFPARATVFAKIGEALKHNRKRYLSRETFIDNNLMAAIPQADIVQPEFLFHLLRTIDIAASDVGTAVPYVKASTLEKIEVDIPPLETQRRIAAILGAYDDLIEVNRRRVAVLEEMARGLFEEWFVRFRFPGHEQVPLLDTPNGPLPQGWTAQPVGETFEMLGGGTPSKTVEAYWEGGSVDWYTPTDLTGAKTMFMDRSATRITEAGLAKSSAKLFPADSIMMTSRATIGAIAINTGPACTNQGFITCLPNERVPRSYLLYWLHQNVPVFISHATGATFKEITKGVFKRLPIVVPPADLVGRFEGQARPMHDMILALERSTRALAASRDLLLPRLISGQLSVAVAERQLEDAA